MACASTANAGHRCGTSRSGVQGDVVHVVDGVSLEAGPSRNWLKANRTMPLPEFWMLVNAKIRGHYDYFSIGDKWPRLVSFKMSMIFLPGKWLNRRSQRQSFDQRTWLEYPQEKVVANLNAPTPHP